MSMRTRALFHLTVGGLLPGCAIGAQAANLGFLSDTPISYMKQRDVGVVLNAKGQSVNLRPQFCEQGSGNWQLQKKH